MSRYIGLDVHSQSTALAVMSESGRRLTSNVVETSARALIDAVKAVPKPRHIVMEEGTQSAWLAEVLSPHAESLVVTVPGAQRAAKNDIEDAFSLAEALRTNAIKKRVFKPSASPLRDAFKLYAALTADVVRAKNRFRALLRSRGVQVITQDPYDPTVKELEAMLRPLTASLRFSAEATLEQVLAVEELRSRAQDVLVDEARQHPAFRLLQTAPGLGVVRSAAVLAIVVSPHRFRQSHQFWKYCGLGIRTTVSSEYVVRGGHRSRARTPMTRGLEPGNAALKNVFSGAALTITRLVGQPLQLHHEELLRRGMKPNLARLTLARKLAAIVLAMWKNMEVYDPAKHHVHQ
jgi:transposase